MSQRLFAKLKTQSDHKARSAIRQLWRKGPGALPLALSLFKETTDAHQKLWLLEYFGAFDQALPNRILFAALKNEKMTMRLHALIALRHRGNPRVAARVRPLLKDESGAIRLHAVETLWALQGQKAKKALLPLRQDAKTYVQRRVKQLLQG